MDVNTAKYSKYSYLYLYLYIVKYNFEGTGKRSK